MKPLTVVAIVVVLAVGGFILLRGANTSPSPQPSTTTKQTPTVTSNDTKENTVVYSNSGFSPGSITVKAGTTVVFKNEGGAALWVASGPHPLHTNYSQFDAKKGYLAGESYSFTFDKAGTYKYHNHLAPAHTGTVVVE